MKLAIISKFFSFYYSEQQARSDAIFDGKIQENKSKT
jgi:hypothetical protein